MRRRSALLALAAAAGGGLWWYASASDATAIRGRLEALVREFNAPAQEGLAAVAHAARIGDFFTEDVVVDLGRGASPIRGRDVLMGMMVRLQGRTAAYRLALEDVTVTVDEGATSASVALTGSVTGRRPETGETFDAREFAVDMRKTGGEWRIARFTAVETLR